MCKSWLLRTLLFFLWTSHVVLEASFVKKRRISRENSDGDDDPVGALLSDIILVDVTKFLPPGYKLGAENIEDESIPDAIEELEEEINISDEIVTDSEHSDEEMEEILQKEMEMSAESVFQAIRHGKSISNTIEKNQVQDKTKKVKRVRVKVTSPSTRSSTVSTTSITTGDISRTTRSNRLLVGATGWFTPVSSTSPTPSPASSTTTTTTRRIEVWREKEERRKEKEAIGKELEEQERKAKSAPRCSPGPDCRLAASIVIVQGLHWDDELNLPGTVSFIRAAGDVGLELKRNLQLGYYGTSFQLLEVRGFTATSGTSVRAEFILQLRTNQFSIPVDQVRKEFESNLGLVGPDEAGTFHYFLGEFEVDPSSIRFQLSVNQLVREARVQEGDTRQEIPEWAWVVIFGGSLSVAMIGFFGCIVAVQRLQNSYIVTRSINSKTLDALKGGKSHLDLGDPQDLTDDYDTAYLKDRRDMWTLQKMHQGRERTLAREAWDRELLSRSSGEEDRTVSFNDGGGTGRMERRISRAKLVESWVGEQEGNLRLFGEPSKYGMKY